MNILKDKNIKENIISYAQRGDGLGAQYHGYLSVIAFCEYHDLNFKHTQFSSIGKYWKNGGAKPLDENDKIETYSENEISKINNFFGFPYEEESYEKKVVKSFPYINEVFKDPDKYFNPSFLSKIRNYYNSSVKPNIEFEKYIVIHIRRGDVSSTKNSDRFIPNIIYNKLIEYLSEKYKDYSIHIVSDGNENDFKDIKNDKIIYHLYEDILFSYHLMVTADILIPSISSLSMTASLLNANKIYHIFDGIRAVPLSSWISLREII